MMRFFGVLASLIVGAIVGSILTFVGYPMLSRYIEPLNVVQESAPAEVEKKPLYWVAPMDPNYRRDKPGQSPMGMDLVPFYEEDGGGSDVGPGAVKISPDVINNLGVRIAPAERGTLQLEIQTVYTTRI